MIYYSAAASYSKLFKKSFFINQENQFVFRPSAVGLDGKDLKEHVQGLLFKLPDIFFGHFKSVMGSNSILE